MAVKTKEEYIESLRALRPTAYMFGQKIDSVVDNPRLRAGIEATAATYEVAQMEDTKDKELKHAIINQVLSMIAFQEI